MSIVLGEKGVGGGSRGFILFGGGGRGGDEMMFGMVDS